MSIKDSLLKLKSNIPPHVSLVAVSKTKPLSDLMEAYNAGHRIFGENKIQEMVTKYDDMPKDVEWHMIGHVQRNKVKYMAEFVHLIHGVDSIKLLKEINKQAEKHNRVIHCLLQIKIAQEDSKFGLTSDDAKELLASEDLKEMRYVRIDGVMGMASFTEDKNQIEQEFKFLKSLFDDFKSMESENCKFEIISMGMSNDYQLAIDCGSNMIRVGSSIFGARNY